MKHPGGISPSEVSGEGFGEHPSEARADDAPMASIRTSVPLGQELLDDWTALVRATRQSEDLDALLVSVGYRPYPAPRSPSPGNERADHDRADAGADADGADGRLAALVAEARHNALAARVVLQRLLPGILSIARRRGDREWRLTLEYYDELLANAWIVIRCYPIHRRPRAVAANLLRDIEYQTFTRPVRLRRVATCTLENPADDDEDTPSEYEVRPSAHPFVEIVEVLHTAALGGLDDHWLEFAAALASGTTLEETAAQRSCSTRAERYRRAQLVSRIRSIVLD